MSEQARTRPSLGHSSTPALAQAGWRCLSSWHTTTGCPPLNTLASLQQRYLYDESAMRRPRPPLGGLLNPLPAQLSRNDDRPPMTRLHNLRSSTSRSPEAVQSLSGLISAENSSIQQHQAESREKQTEASHESDAAHSRGEVEDRKATARAVPCADALTDKSSNTPSCFPTQRPRTAPP